MNQKMKQMKENLYEPPRANAYGIELQGILCGSEIIGNSLEEVTVEEFEFP